MPDPTSPGAAASPPSSASPAPSDPSTAERTLGSGPGRLLVAVYGILALAATGRSVMQIALFFSRAPLAYLLSALAAVIYLVATIALVRGGDRWTRIAWAAITVELVGVLVVGAASYAAPSAFPDKTVWSHFGSGYGFVPLVLPVLGLWWLRRHAAARASATQTS